jgi:hypothetical protein
MQTKIKAPKNGTIRKRVRTTRVFRDSNRIQQGIISTNQNLKAINNSLFLVKQKGIKHWETISQNTRSNAEIIRELYTNQLEVKF